MEAFCVGAVEEYTCFKRVLLLCLFVLIVLLKMDMLHFGVPHQDRNIDESFVRVGNDRRQQNVLNDSGYHKITPVPKLRYDNGFGNDGDYDETTADEKRNLHGDGNDKRMFDNQKNFYGNNNRRNLNQRGLLLDNNKNMPKFDQKNIATSLREFELFFRLYNFCEEEKFQILVEAAPWSLISIYIESRANKPLNLSSLLVYFKSCSTPVYPLQRLFDKFSYNKPVQELFNSCNIVNSCSPDDVYKLALYTALPEHAKCHFKNKLHLPLELLKTRIAEFWEDNVKPDHHLLQQDTECRLAPQKPVPKPRRHNVPEPTVTCYYHWKFGRNAYKCEGPPCALFSQLSFSQQSASYQTQPSPHFQQSASNQPQPSPHFQQSASNPPQPKSYFCQEKGNARPRS